MPRPMFGLLVGISLATVASASASIAQQAGVPGVFDEASALPLAVDIREEIRRVPVTVELPGGGKRSGEMIVTS